MKKIWVPIVVFVFALLPFVAGNITLIWAAR